MISIIKERAIELTIAMITIFFGVLMYLFLKGNIGVSHDSIYYFRLANELYEKHSYNFELLGVYQACAHYPPIYPMVLGFVAQLTTLPYTVVAIIVNSLCFGFSLLGLYRIFNTFKSLGILSLALALFILVQKGMIDLYIMAWSEPLFITLMIWGLYLFGRSLKMDSLYYAIAASTILGIATLTRYVGYLFVPLVFFVLLHHCQEDWRKNIKHIIAITLPYFAIVASWWARNIRTLGTAQGREGLKDQVIPHGQFDQLIATINNWIFNQSIIPKKIIALMVLASVAYIAWSALCNIIRGNVSNDKTLIHKFIWGLFFLGYFPFLIYSILYADRMTPWDSRILSPVQVAFWVCVFLSLISLVKNNDFNHKHKLAGLLLFASSVLMVYFINHASNHRADFQAPNYFIHKPFLNEIKAMEVAPLYADEFDDLYISYLLNKEVDHISELEKKTAIGQKFYVTSLNNKSHWDVLKDKTDSLITIIPDHLYMGLRTK